MKKKLHARFGARYGKRIRGAVLEAEAKYKKRYACPGCSRIALRRLASGIWQCRKCKMKYAGGAYEWRA